MVSHLLVGAMFIYTKDLLGLLSETSLPRKTVVASVGLSKHMTYPNSSSRTLPLHFDFSNLSPKNEARSHPAPGAERAYASIAAPPYTMPSMPQSQESTLSTPASSHHHTTTPITTNRTPSAFQPQVGAFFSPPSPTAPTTKISNSHDQISNLLGVPYPLTSNPHTDLPRHKITKRGRAAEPASPSPTRLLASSPFGARG